ncbi:MAG: Gfo/Idh/MocA family oxidoreductase [Planctomycetia bacterium]|nr:Gfo/Idh/MocA family oxidoreductase [Planctomycetia bacterium]
MKSSFNRRDFLKSGSLLGSALLVPSFALGEEKPLANQAPSDRLRCACIGVGPMGSGDANEFNGLTDVVAVCDIDSKYRLERLLKNKNFGKKENGKETVDTYSDYRRVLDRKDIDLVSISTPDHWHVKIAIEAMQAGKHVFCQKPLTLTIAENLLVRKAVEKYGKIFQVGTQQRSMKDKFMAAALLVRNGYLGDIKRVVCTIDTGRQSGIIPLSPAPETLDWNMWCGQAPVKPHRWTNDTQFFSASNAGQSRGHLNFRWWFEYSGGRITDWGAHHIDCALWAINKQTIGSGPTSVESSNVKFVVPYKDGYPTRDDMYNTPYEYDIRCHFPDGIQMDIVCKSEDGNGILFEGTKGKIHVNRGRLAGRIIKEGALDTLKEEQYIAINNGKPIEGHKQNLLRCIREGGTPVSDVASNIQSMHICHLANISCRLGRTIHWDSTAETILNDPQAAAFISREQRKGFELPSV